MVPPRGRKKPDFAVIQAVVDESEREAEQQQELTLQLRSAMADGDQREAAIILAGLRRLWVEEQKTNYTLLEVRGPNQSGYKEQMENWRASTLSKGRFEGEYEVFLNEINEPPSRARQRQQLNELQDTAIPSAAESSTDSIATITSFRPTSIANNTERSFFPDQTPPLAQGTIRIRPS